MPFHLSHLPQQHAQILDSLASTSNLLVIQDLDGVCMGLVGDPLTRRIERRYVRAAGVLDRHFSVLTNGEHVGRRGVNGIIDRAFDEPMQGFYLPGLAAGGVQFQDRSGCVSHPGVSDVELAFLADVPRRAARFLSMSLLQPPFSVPADLVAGLVETCVLDNLASPTLNLNGLYTFLRASPAVYRQLQQVIADFMQGLLDEACGAGLKDSFFVHYAPNRGRGAQGLERLAPGDGQQAGTTDFQFMLRGAVKEAGVLDILNRYYHGCTGEYPLGEGFNVRMAPQGQAALTELARRHFDPALMPRLLGVGDTVSSLVPADRQAEPVMRGGSDRGFLSLVQALGQVFAKDNLVAYVDSSDGEVRRPGVDAAHLQRCRDDPQLSPWAALRGISDAEDPLQLNLLFCGGHPHYVDFFCELADRHCGLRPGR